MIRRNVKRLDVPAELTELDEKLKALGIPPVYCGSECTIGEWNEVAIKFNDLAIKEHGDIAKRFLKVVV